MRLTAIASAGPGPRSPWGRAARPRDADDIVIGVGTTGMWLGAVIWILGRHVMFMNDCLPELRVMLYNVMRDKFGIKI